MNLIQIQRLREEKEYKMRHGYHDYNATPNTDLKRSADPGMEVIPNKEDLSDRMPRAEHPKYEEGKTYTNV